MPRKGVFYMRASSLLAILILATLQYLYGYWIWARIGKWVAASLLRATGLLFFCLGSDPPSAGARRNR